MNEILNIQNSDVPANNPFNSETASASAAPKSKFQFPHDKRLIALIFMGGFILLLSLVSLVVAAARHQSTPNLSTVNLSPTPTPAAVSPTVNPNNIPDAFQPQFNQTGTLLQITPELLPPQVDLTVGQ